MIIPCNAKQINSNFRFNFVWSEIFSNRSPHRERYAVFGHTLSTLPASAACSPNTYRSSWSSGTALAALFPDGHFSASWLWFLRKIYPPALDPPSYGYARATYKSAAFHLPHVETGRYSRIPDNALTRFFAYCHMQFADVACASKTQTTINIFLAITQPRILCIMRYFCVRNYCTIFYTSY